MIHHMALLRMETCKKFCLDREAEEELIDEKIPQFEESKKEYFVQAIELCQEKGHARAE